MHYRIRYMHVKYQLNRDIRFVKTVKTKKSINFISLQLAIRISKNCSFQTCITPPPIFVSNLRPIGLLVIVQPSSKVFFYERRTDGQTSRVTTSGSFFQREKTTKNEIRVSSYNMRGNSSLGSARLYGETDLGEVPYSTKTCLRKRGSPDMQRIWL